MTLGFSKLIKRHKFITGIIIILILAGGYYGYKTLKKGGSNQSRYVLAAVERGTLLVSVSGSGQVSASDQIDVKSKASGDIIYVGVKKGQATNAGALLAQIDDADAQKAVEDAEKNLEEEKLNLNKLEGMTTDEGVWRGEKEKAIDSLNKAYEDGFNNVANIFLELPDIMADLHDMIFSNNFSSVQWNVDYYADEVKYYDQKSLQYRDDVYKKYQIARAAYDKNFEDYKSTNRFSEKETISSLIDETYETTKDIAETIKSLNNLIQFYQDKLAEVGSKPQTLSNTHLSSLSTYTGKTNTYLLNLLSAKTSIQSSKETVIQSTFDIQDQKDKVAEAEQALNDAKEKLVDYKIYSPIGGIVTEMNIEKGDSVSAGTALATIITSQEIAEISLNEVDAAKVKIGQKASLTLDAISDLTLTGKVLDIDTIGTVSQGVVSYNVKLSLDTQNEKVKPGMTVSANIITEAKQDILLVANSAIKQQNGVSYVEAPNALDATAASAASASGIILKNPIEQKQIETGSSNDEYTEVVSGLSEGDTVITRTIQNSSTQTSSSSQTGTQTGVFGIPGAGGLR